MVPILFESNLHMENHRCFIIAEAGVNHNGDLKTAKTMVDVAKEIGADAVKFQTFKTEKLVTERARKAEYQKSNSNEKSQFEMLKRLELTADDFNILFNYCIKKDIIFLSTPFDLESANLLQKIDVKAFKIGSGDITDHGLLTHIAKWKKPIILSTGMSTIKEIEESINIIKNNGNEELVLLHCTSSYPVEIKDANIRMIKNLRDTFKLPIGFSDHTMSTIIPAAAVALGAVIVEKHFTLDHDMAGPDHKMALEPNQFIEMIKNIREVEAALGDGIKKITKTEKKIREIARKSIVATQDIDKGIIITQEMLDIKRPGTGIEPKFIKKIIGKKTKKTLSKDEILKWEWFEK